MDIVVKFFSSVFGYMSSQGYSFDLFMLICGFIISVVGSYFLLKRPVSETLNTVKVTSQQTSDMHDSILSSEIFLSDIKELIKSMDKHKHIERENIIKLLERLDRINQDSVASHNTIASALVGIKVDLAETLMLITNTEAISSGTKDELIRSVASVSSKLDTMIGIKGLK